MPVEGRLRYLTLAALPMLGALAGGWLDERLRLGFSAWRSACRASGIGLSSLVHFTLQLMPFALIGLLCGGAVVLAIAMLGPRDSMHARACLAAHAGCALTLPLGLLICATTLPLPAMLLADVALSALAASMLLWSFERLGDSRTPAPSGVLRTRAAPRA